MTHVVWDAPVHIQNARGDRCPLIRNMVAMVGKRKKRAPEKKDVLVEARWLCVVRVVLSFREILLVGSLLMRMYWSGLWYVCIRLAGCAVMHCARFSSTYVL